MRSMCVSAGTHSLSAFPRATVAIGKLLSCKHISQSCLVQATVAIFTQREVTLAGAVAGETCR